MSLATLEEYKLYAKISKNTEDTYHQSILDASSVFIEKYTNLSFTETPFFDIVSINDAGFVVLEESPIVAVTSVTPLDVDGSDLTALPTTAYLVDSQSGVLSFRNLTNINTSRMFNARVDYTAGYSEPPLDIKQACMDLTTYYIKREFVQQKRTQDNSQVSFQLPDSSLPPHIGRVLDMYRDYV